MTDQTHRPAKPAMLRGLLNRCPSCGEGKLFARFLKPTASCSACGSDWTGHAADDFPPYLSIFLTGHIVIPAMLEVEMAYHPSMMTHVLIWPALTLVLALGFLQPLKGAVVAYQWANRMHGFGSEPH